MSQSELTTEQKNEAFQHLLDYERYAYVERSVSEVWGNLYGLVTADDIEQVLGDSHVQMDDLREQSGRALAAAAKILLPYPETLAFMMAVAHSVYEKNIQVVVDEQVSLVITHQGSVEG